MKVKNKKILLILCIVIAPGFTQYGGDADCDVQGAHWRLLATATEVSLQSPHSRLPAALQGVQALLHKSKEHMHTHTCVLAVYSEFYFFAYERTLTLLFRDLE